MSTTRFSSHTAHLPDGIDIFFTDSGPPPNSIDYTTLVVLHGSGFTGQCMEKLHDYAHDMNLRTVIWNRRGYPGSTEYTEAEMDDLIQGRQVFFDRQSVLLVHFLQQLVENENIPRINAGHKSGGIAIMGWSMGCTMAMTLFSDGDLIPPDSYTLLEKYVKDLILYDPSIVALGYEIPADANQLILHNPWAGNTSPEVIQHNFNIFLRMYYDQPEHPSSINELQTIGSPVESSAIDMWEADIEKYYYAAAMSSEMPMFKVPMQQTIKELAKRVLEQDISETVFPDSTVIFLRPTRTQYRCFWCGIQAKRNYDENVRNGRHVRSAVFLPVEGGNHFTHLDMPLQLMQVVAHAIQR